VSRILSFKIKSHTHLLHEDVFNIFKQNEMCININYLKSNQLVLTISDIKEPGIDDNEFVTKAHAIINLYLVSLNVCTLGLFLPYEDHYLSSSYELHNFLTKRSERGFVIHDIHANNPLSETITEEEVKNSLWLYGALAKETNQEIISEYLKGLVHLNLNHPGVNFEKDAFANFYRVFEHLVTNRILKKQKLENELKQIQNELSSMGLGSDIKKEFMELYKIRSCQAMHAQLLPQRIDRETSLKMKVFTDVIFFRVYKAVWGNFKSTSL
jgi:hypothetical protein